MFSVVSVCSQRDPHVTITHDVFDLNLQDCLPHPAPWPPPSCSLDIKHGSAWPPPSDIWWPSQKTCSNLFT